MSQLSRRRALGLLAASAAIPLFPRPLRAASTVVGALRFTSHAPSFVAFERGYFSDEGLAVNFEFFQAAQPMAVAVAAGSVDFAVTAISGGLISLAAKGATRVIGGALSEEPGISGQKILAANAAFEAGLTEPAKLAGLRFGVTQPGSSFHYMGSRIAGAEALQLRFIPLQKVPAIIGALKSGQIDAWSIVPHIAAPLAASGAVQVIGEVASYLPDYQVTTVFTSTQIAASDRARSEAFLRAFSRGAADFNAALVDKTAGEAATEAMIQLIHKYVYTEQPYEKARQSIIDGAMRINANAALKAGSVHDQLDWFRSEGLVDPQISFETLVDPSYVEMI